MNLLKMNSSIMSFCIYGLGSTGKSAAKYLKSKNYHNVKIWDDKKKTKTGKKTFLKYLDSCDYIILSPGINLKKSKLKNKLLRNKHKIITDLDLFYLFNPNIRSIVVTGTNGKSTTCKILEHVLKKNRINVKLGGNIGKPVLNLKLNKRPIVIIEASSFQLAYSKYIKPNYAAILNITKDHLDRHGTMKEYINSKLKIFSNQKSDDFAFLNNQNIIKKFKKNNYESKLQYVKTKKYKRLQKKIKNNYLNSKANKDNMNYIYEICEIFKIKNKNVVKSLKNFKGLNHRYEIFYKNHNKTFINDSKATSFQSSKFALQSNKNIFWIVGGLPKLGDKININEVKRNIVKAYIIGKNTKFFKKFFNRNIKYEVSNTMKNAVISIFKDTKKIKHKNLNILLSPASASYDQYENFEERGDQFKKIVLKHARKNF